MKPYRLPQDRMPEAEVSLRLAFYLLKLPGSQGEAKVAIDGAKSRFTARGSFLSKRFSRQSDGNRPSKKRRTLGSARMKKMGSD
jgi:hypothetical protein